jgi:site-specific DNA-methyltransferase (adenine-specific)
MEIKLNAIYQMDCLEYLKSLPDECTECVLFDEPYGVLTGHKIEEGYNLDIAKQVRIEAMRVLKPDGWFIFFSQAPMDLDFRIITRDVGFKPWQQCNEIVWCKRNSSNPFGKIGRIHENIFVFQKGNPQIYENKAPFEDIIVDNAFHGVVSFAAVKRYIAALKQKDLQEKIANFTPTQKKCNDDIYKNTQKKHRHVNVFSSSRLPSIWSFTKENCMTLGKNSLQNHKHPTVKPVLLIRRLIKLFTKQGDTVLDCFLGSGTTALACKIENRNFLGCERDEGYVKIANDRLENWQQDLERQDKWLNDRGVMDFEADAKVEKQDIQGSLL